ncbi:MAG: SDR family oxidoreductase [Sporocytophaga sp.]|uniref:SDR family NAD(P)-dependent oxidoreductase n=1 Tax=Sporocytophaga sp. TaxID=2231183 RepID=UPI001B2866DB|nr:SDR family oxidoreductase [Sporocytophaga sp.]MBO9700645.1 SDR family oxidoreductase [Sporocytophaga sp.]
MRYTLITGASRGIGLAMAEYCAAKNLNMVLVSRSENKLWEIAARLKATKKIDVKVYPADLTESGVCEKLYDWCVKEGINVNMLINNAGAGLYGKFSSLSLEDQLNLIRLNQCASVSLIYNFIPMLKKAEGGYIMNVASTACYQPIPFMSVYAATQSFLHSYTLALREELKPFNISVSCLCPGPTATDFFEEAGLKNLPVDSSEVKMSPEEVAEIAVEGMLEHDSEIIPGTSNMFGAYFSKIFPNKFIVRTLNRLFAPKN